MVGMGILTHGPTGLSHQHWVDQVISSGSFGVHCTQAAESYHKLCAKLPSERVRHLHRKKTQLNMLEYLKSNSLFEVMSRTPTARQLLEVSPTIGCPLLISMDAYDSTFIHPEVRITRAELIDMMCMELNYPGDQAPLFTTLQYRFGQKLTRRDGRIFWATDTRYNYDTGLNSRKRRDVLHIKGTEQVRGVTNALCCEAVCFISVMAAHLNLSALYRRQLQETGSLVLVLGRWFSPHPNAIHRDSQSRPVCPGELHINHCLWKYAVTPAPRRSIVLRNGNYTPSVFRSPHIFGTTVDAQRRCMRDERRAYYCLLTPENIEQIVHMCPEFVPGTSTPDTSTWLQTVALV